MRVDSDGCIVILDGPPILPLAKESVATVEVGGGGSRVESDHRVEILDGPVEFPFLKVGDAPAAMGFGVVGSMLMAAS